MSQLPFTPCLHPWCNNYAYQAGRCREHYVPWVGSNRKERLPKGWGVLRDSILIRDKGKCYLCGQAANEVDHVEPGDNHKPSNLAAICTDCHRRKSAAEGHAAQGHKARHVFPGEPF